MLVMNFLGDAISYGFHWILLWIDSVVYWAASKCYQLFMMIATARIFEDEFFANFARRIYAILGVFMLFYLAYALLNAIVDPDKYSKGEKGVGNIAVNFVISLVILGLVPTIFSYAYRVQNFILSEDVLGTVILGTKLHDIDENATIKFGDSVSFSVLNTFINPYNVPTSMGKSAGYSWFDCKKIILEESDYFCLTGLANPYVYKNDKDDIKYYGIISTIVGGYLVYLLFSFALDLGVRVIKLAFYQLIAPIPIIMRALPSKKASFDKWLKKTLATYADVFVRVGFMYMSVYFISRIVTNTDIAEYLNNGFTGLLVLTILIIGIFTFAKQASKEISDILGVDAKINMGIKDKLKAGGPLGNLINNASERATGLVTGAAGGAWTAAWNPGGLKSFGHALRLGAINGFDGKGQQFSKQRQDIYKTMGYKGKAGLFGKRALVDYWQDKYKDKYSDYYKDKVLSEKVNNYENPTKNVSWANEFNDNLKKQLSQIGLEGLSIADFNATKRILEELDKKRKDLINDKMRELRAALADSSKSVEEKQSIYQKIDMLKRGDYSFMLNEDGTAKEDEGKIAKDLVENINATKAQEYKIGGPRTETIKSWVYDESKKKAVIKEELVTPEEAAAYKATRKHFRDVDIDYDRMVATVTTRMTESSNKEWATTEEGQHLIYAHAQANKAAEGKAAPLDPKPPLGGDDGPKPGGKPGA